MDVFKCIKSRRSVRKFTKETIDKEQIEKILEYGRWAPSGLNHQPWKVIVVSNPEIKSSLADCTHYDRIVNEAPHLFVILLDKNNTYSYVKNVQSVGAFFQNLLLGIHDQGLGGVWLGEIYNQKEQVQEILKVNSEKWEFMGAISFGYSNEKGSSTRKAVKEFVEWK